MQNFMKTILSAVQAWTKGKIKDSTADWNQNDSTADNYVKNRTHWEETFVKTFVNNLTFEEYNNGNAPKCTFTPGNKYTVIWNGVTYNDLVCYTDGEFHVLATTDNYPFYIDDNGGNGLYIEKANEEEESFTISIFGNTTIVHKLDSKYINIPDNLATTDDVQFVEDMVDEAKYDAIEQAVEQAKNELSFPILTINSYSATTSGCAGIVSQNIGLKHGAIYAIVPTVACNNGNVPMLKINDTSYYIYASYPNDGLNSSIVDYQGGINSSIRSNWYFRTDRPRLVQYSAEEKCFFTIDLYNTKGYLSKSGVDWNVLSEDQPYDYFMVCTGDFHNMTPVRTKNLILPSSTDGSTKWFKIAVDDNGTYACMINNDASGTESLNIHSLDWDGNAWYSGDVYVGSTSGTNKDDGSKKLATEDFVGTKVAELVNSAPETLDTLGELATALTENQDVITTLNASITNKTDKTEFNTLSQ